MPALNETPKFRKINKGSSKDKKKGLCDICGDWATGIHYKAVTCEGCKGFFRRSQQQGLTYKCLGNNDCVINKHNRNSCQGCRYSKCLSVMSPELVMPPAERDAKRELIEHNRQRRELSKNLSDTVALGIHPLTSTDEDIIDQLHMAYGKIFMESLDLYEEKLKDLNEQEQNEAMVMEMKEKCREYIEIGKEIKSIPETILEMHTLYRVDIFLMEIMSNIDISPKELSLKNGTTLKLNSLDLPQQLLNDFLSLTNYFQSLFLPTEAMAIIAAILCCQPSPISAAAITSFMASNNGLRKVYEVVDGVKSKYTNLLISFLQYNNMMVEARADTMYPKVAAFIHMLSGFCSRYHTELLRHNAALTKMFR